MATSSSSELGGRAVLITGAGHGIGRATSRLFAERGARVALADIDPARAKAVAEECSELGAEAVPLTVDVRQRASVDAMVAATVDAFGRLDALANVAGIYPQARVADLSQEVWEDVLAVNLTGTFLCCQAALPHLAAHEVGSIVNITSGAARIPYPGLAAYGASKGGVISFTRTLAYEAAPAVRVNVIGPGPTDITEGAPRERTEVTALADMIPMGRWATPRDIAEGIVFLSSERASFITGQVLHVNGGRSMH